MYKLPGFGTLSGRSTSAFSTLKTMALAPMASARVSTAVRANPGALRNCRRASRRVALMRPSLELWGRSFRGTRGTRVCFSCTHRREPRFHLKLPGSQPEPGWIVSHGELSNSIVVKNPFLRCHPGVARSAAEGSVVVHHTFRNRGFIRGKGVTQVRAVRRLCLALVGNQDTGSPSRRTSHGPASLRS